jgi:hypothetical protein
MTPEKTREALEKIAELARRNTTNPVRLSESDRKLTVPELLAAHPVDGRMRLCAHVLYLALDGIELVAAGRETKAHRHLGWCQGAVWGLGLVSIDELMQMNRPAS